MIYKLKVDIDSKDVKSGSKMNAKTATRPEFLNCKIKLKHVNFKLIYVSLFTTYFGFMIII